MIALKKVEPTHRTVAFMSNADGTSSVGEVMICRATDEGERLRTMRVNAGASLRDGATALGLSVVDYSGLEGGARIPVDGWGVVFAVVPQAWKDAHPRGVLALNLGDVTHECVCGTERDDGECMACAQKECPHGEPLHWHHDGCPACHPPVIGREEAGDG